MTIERGHGNLITAEVDALVNTVNTEGVMGKGLALQFKKAFPDAFTEYERACKAGEVVVGRMRRTSSSTSRRRSIGGTRRSSNTSMPGFRTSSPRSASSTSARSPFRHSGAAMAGSTGVTSDPASSTLSDRFPTFASSFSSPVMVRLRRMSSIGASARR